MKIRTEVFVSICVLLAVFWFYDTKNSLVSLKEDVEMQQSQIDTVLKRQNDLIPCLVAIVKEYVADHDEDVFTEITDARSELLKSIESGDMESISKANAALYSALDRLLAISKNNPDLTTCKEFIELQDELDKIDAARKYYNDKVNTYNTTVQSFPTSIIARIGKYYPTQCLEADENAK